VLTAQACAELARRCRNARDLSPDEFYSCGLLHDLGKVVMLDSLGETYAEIVDRARLCAEPLQVLEQRELGYDHTAVGAVIAARWGLPEPVSAAIRYHHGPREAVRDSAVVSLVANANLLVQRIVQSDLARAADVFDAATAAFLGLSAGDVAEVFGYFVEQHALVEI
jgi:putative nucleotidyltransferase with HDIG domain